MDFQKLGSVCEPKHSLSIVTRHDFFDAFIQVTYAIEIIFSQLLSHNLSHVWLKHFTIRLQEIPKYDTIVVNANLGVRSENTLVSSSAGPVVIIRGRPIWARLTNPELTFPAFKHEEWVRCAAFLTYLAIFIDTLVKIRQNLGSLFPRFYLTFFNVFISPIFGGWFFILLRFLIFIDIIDDT